jgi:protein ImuB
VPRTAAKFAAECSFEGPVEGQETIDAACRALVRQVAAPLAARQEGAVQLECRFDCPPCQPVRLAVGLFRPSAAAEHLWQLLRLRLESLRLPAAVTGVRLEVLASAPLAWQQQELFDTDRCQGASRQAALLIDRLSNRLGRQAVVRGVPLSDAQPEHACMYLPLAGGVNPRGADSRPAKRRRGKPAATRDVRDANTAAPFEGDQRPLLLKAQPLLLQRVSQSRNAAPRAFRLAGRDYRLARTWGPERIETGWWRTGLVRRDYYRVETTAGSRYWIFHDLRTHRWFLHGEFG